MLEAHGYRPDVKILLIKREVAGNEIAGELQLTAKAPILVVEKLFLEDKQPVILVRNHIPVKLLIHPYSEKDLKEPVFEFLEHFAGQHLSYYLSELVPVMADDSLLDTLELQDPSPLISVEEIGYNDENQPILRACSYFRDDLVRLRLLRRKI